MPLARPAPLQPPEGPPLGAPPQVTAPLPLWRSGEGTPPSRGRFLALVPGEAAPLLPLSVEGLPAGRDPAARLSVARQQLRRRLGPEAAARLDIRPAPLGGGPAGWSRVLIAEPADLLRWRAELGAALPRARALLPDYLALPAAPGLWVLAAGPDCRIRARLGPADGFAAEAPLAAALLARGRQQAAPRAVLVLEGPLPEEVAAALDGLPVSTDPDRLPTGIAAPQWLAQGELDLDLREDPLTRAAALAAWLRGLVLPAMLALLGLAGWLGALLHETRGLQDRAARLQDATLEAVRRDILPSGPILDIRLQVAREIAQRQEAAQGHALPAGGMELLHRAAAGLEGAGITPQGLRLAPETAAAGSAAGFALDVDLLLPDFAGLDRVIGQLGQADLSVELQRSGSQSGGRVSAGLRLTLPVPDSDAGPAE